MKTRNEQLQYLSLAIVLSLGVGLGWACLGAILFGTAQTLLAPGHVSDTRYESLQFLRDGTPLILTSYGGGRADTAYSTLDGKTYDKPIVRQLESIAFLGDPLPPDARVDAAQMLRSRIAFVPQNWGGMAWFFVHDGMFDGHGYFVGYDRNTRLRIGYIGRNGFCSAEPPTAEQFPVDGRMNAFGRALCYVNRRYKSSQEVENTPTLLGDPSVYLLTDDGLELINLYERTAKLVLKDRHLVSASCPNGQLVVRTPDSIRFLHRDGKEMRSYPLPVQFQSQAEAYIHQYLYELPDNGVILYDATQGDVFWLDAAGKVVRNEHVKLQRGQRWMSQRAELFVTSTLLVPSPGAMFIALTYRAWDRIDAGWPRALWNDWWPGLLASSLISIVLACFCYHHHRKYGLPWPWMWTIFVLLFGVPAFLGYLVHRSWPARLACPNCGRLAPRDRPACFACGTAFPPPPQKGIEVFA